MTTEEKKSHEYAYFKDVAIEVFEAQQLNHPRS